MNIIITILLVVAGIIALALIIINAPRQKVFDFLKLLKDQEQFNKRGNG